jgi:CDP-diacylglycerol--glycerol-3-phosphate 3-phosphatidyltransferase
MTVYDLKPAFQNLLRPLCKILANAGVTANQVTIVAVVMSVLVGLIFAFFPSSSWAAFLVPFALFVRMALNAIDGMLAREYDMQSNLGGILNELTDVISDAALYLPFAFVPGISPVLVVAAVVLAMLSEMTGVVTVQIGGTRRYDGPMGKSDRAAAFGLLALLLGFGVAAGLWTAIALVVVCALMVWTIFKRASGGLDEAEAGSDAATTGNP